jgi:hypothetical protein
MKYKVRDQFYVYLDGQVSEPGTVLDLDDAQYGLVAHQVEPVEAPKPASRKVKADGAE